MELRFVGGCEAGRCGNPVFIALGCSKQGRGEIWRRIRFGGKKKENPAGVGRKKETLTRGATVSAKETGKEGARTLNWAGGRGSAQERAGAGGGSGLRAGGRPRRAVAGLGRNREEK
jgi:hypothetical protein